MAPALRVFFLLGALTHAVAACSDDGEASSGEVAGSSTDAGAGGTAGSSAGSGGTAGTAGPGGTAGAAGDTAGAAGTENAEWHYGNEPGGPDDWGTLDPDYQLCGTGQQQSPIDIPDGIAAGEDAALVQSYQASALRPRNTGHTIQINYDAGSTLSFGGATYQLAQFHFHAHSEHTVSGVSYPLEVHFVHTDPQGNLAVVGVFLKEGAESAAFKPVFDHLPTTAGPEQPVEGMTIDATLLLPASHQLWEYDGSLTTPPCRQGVSWFVMAEPVEVSAAQIASLTAIYDHNFRPTQPLNGRTIDHGAQPLTRAAHPPVLTVAVPREVLALSKAVAGTRLGP